MGVSLSRTPLSEERLQRAMSSITGAWDVVEVLDALVKRSDDEEANPFSFDATERGAIVRCRNVLCEHNEKKQTELHARYRKEVADALSFNGFMQAAADWSLQTVWNMRNAVVRSVAPKGCPEGKGEGDGN